MFLRTKTPAKFRNTPLADLPRWELERLNQLGTEVEVDAGRQIIADGSYGSDAFVVLDGDFEVQGNGFKASISKGDVTGELASFTGQARSASVTASTPARVLSLSAREFATLLHEAPKFRSHVVTAASNRLEDATDGRASDKAVSPHFKTYFR